MDFKTWWAAEEQHNGYDEAERAWDYQQAEIERLNARLATVQKQADDMVAKHSVLTDNVIACNAVINDNARARQRLESVIDTYKDEVAYLRGRLNVDAYGNSI